MQCYMASLYMSVVTSCHQDYTLLHGLFTVLLSHNISVHVTQHQHSCFTTSPFMCIAVKAVPSCSPAYLPASSSHNLTQMRCADTCVNLMSDLTPDAPDT